MKHKHTFFTGILLPALLMLTSSAWQDRQYAPVSTIAEVFSSEQTAVVTITATGFTNIASCNLQLLYDPAVALATRVSPGPGMSGLFSVNLTTPGVIRLAWSSVRGITLDDHSEIFSIRFERLGAGTTPITWDAAYSSRNWGDGTGLLTIDRPMEDFYLPGSLTFQGGVFITLMLQGLYNPSTGLMNRPMDHDGEKMVFRYPGGIAGQVGVRLHDAGYFERVILELEDVLLLRDGRLGFDLPEQLQGSYYISIITRNHLLTVTARPVELGQQEVHYDFTASACMAWGSSQTELIPGVWGFFAGDVNQDGIIDTDDRQRVNSMYLSTTRGYFPEDLNGDGLIDLADREMINDNLLQGIRAAVPIRNSNPINPITQ